jgi:hypothetical protein
VLNLLPGSYVTHAKLPDLGSGEILAAHDGRVCIRFASGSRDFMMDRVLQHLSLTSEAPAPTKPAAKSPKRARKVAARKTEPKAEAAKAEAKT